MTNNDLQQNDNTRRTAQEWVGQTRAGQPTKRAAGAQGVPMAKVGPMASAGSASVGGAAAPQQKGSKRTVIVVLGVVIAAIAIWLLIWIFACGGPGMFDPNAQNGQAPYKTAEEMQAELDRVVDEGMFNISIASAIEFADGTSSGTAYIENVPGNHYNMQVAITDDSSGDLLYESGVLKPNQFIESITLTRDLDPGVYPATATFTAMDPTTYDEVGQAAAKIAINVTG